MWSTPRSTTTYVAPEEEIESNTGRQYLVRPVEIKDDGVSQFADPADANPQHNIRWTFTLHDPDTRVAILNIDGAPYEHIDFTSSRTGRGRSNVARAREWMEALMGRDLEDGEINDALTEELLKHAALAIFESQEKTSKTGEPYLKLRIDKMFPYRPKRSSTPAPAAAAPASRQATRPAAGKDDLPWP